MATAPNSTTVSNAAAAVGIKNRLSRDLDELQRAAAAAATLPADDAGNLFDLTVSLHQVKEALTTAIADCDRYITATRAQRAELARQVAAEFNADVFGIAA